MPYDFELVRVEYDFPMAEMRSCAIIDGRHITICAYSVGYVNSPPIVAKVSAVRYRSIRREDMPFADDEIFFKSEKYSSAFVFEDQGEVRGQIICSSVLCVSTPAFKFERIAFNAGDVVRDKDSAVLFRWQQGHLGTFNFTDASAIGAVSKPAIEDGKARDGG